MSGSSTVCQDDIAVIGLSCRFPGEAATPEGFLNLLEKGKGAFSEVPKERFDIDAFYHPSIDHRGTTVAREGCFLEENVAQWDAPFFSTSAQEANAMDPQQRLLLEVAYEGLENAGLSLSAVAGSDMACYVGHMKTDYEYLSLRDIQTAPKYRTTGLGSAINANRLSWFYDLRGPSTIVDTGCSASLVALHLACETIRSNKNPTTTALVGGCGLILAPETMTGLSALHFLSPDGKSHCFDERANGYGRGEGVAILVLKRMDEALRDGDMIRAVIRGTGVNQDGHTSGLTLPSSEAQARLIRETYAAYDLEPLRTSYFEAHGTGTAAGDPIEARAIGEALGSDPRRRHPLYIGSVKANIGHLEGAAGVASVIKCILSLETGNIFAQHDFQRPNPRIDFQTWNLDIPTKLTVWPTSGLRRASVNSFGYGGTNAHVILDDARSYLQERSLVGFHNTVGISSVASSESGTFRDSAVVTSYDADLDQQADYFAGIKLPQPYLFTISSSEQAALARVSANLRAYLQNQVALNHVQTDQCLASLAYTLNCKRTTFQWRTSVVASSANELHEALEAASKTSTKAKKTSGQLWVFTGQGAQWAQMAVELLQYQVFADAIESADQCFQSLGADWDLRSELLADAKSSRIDQPAYAQPLTTAIQIALVDLLRHWGIVPNAVVGHSSGEIAAAYTIGALSAPDALKVAYHRGRLSQQLSTSTSGPCGRMLSVGLSRSEVTTYLEQLPTDSTAVVACDNSPVNVTISGDKEALQIIEQRAQAAGVFARTLRVTNAYHSPHMQAIATVYQEAIGDIQSHSKRTKIRMYSTVTGRLVEPETLDSSYWVRNMVQPVEFVTAIHQVLVAPSRRQRRQDGHAEVSSILEIGPHGALSGPIKQFLDKHSLTERISVSSLLMRGRSTPADVLKCIGKLWASGQQVKFELVNSTRQAPEFQRTLVDLPPYPWNHNLRYWSESAQSQYHRNPVCGRLDYVGGPVDAFNPSEPLFKNHLQSSEIPWVLDHQVQNDIVFPGAGMICAAIEASRQFAHTTAVLTGFNLRDIRIGKALIVPSDGTGIQTYLSLKPRKAGMRSTAAPWQEFTFYTVSESGVSSEHCSGLISLVYASTHSEVDSGKEAAAEIQEYKQLFASAVQKCNKSMSKSQHYNAMEDIGIHYGPMFQGLSEIVTGPATSVYTIIIPDTRSVMPSQVETENVIHPAVLDALFQSCFPACTGNGVKAKEAMVPTQIDHIFVPVNLPRSPGAGLRSVTQTSRYGMKGMRVDITGEVTVDEEKPLIIRGLTVTGIGSNDTAELSGDETNIKSKICSEVILRPDMGLLTQDQAVELLATNREDPATLQRGLHDSAQAATIWCQRTLAQISPDDVSKLAPHFQHYHQWMADFCSIAQAKMNPYQYGVEDWLNIGNDAQDSFLKEFASSNGMMGRFMETVSQHHLEMIQGNVPVLEVLTRDDMLTRFYTDPTIFGPSICAMRDWFDLAGHKNPDMKVLEVGAGSGSITFPILETLGGRSGSPARFGSYTFTDISSGFFEKAQDSLRDWGSLVEFKKLDIEKDPESQGFEAESFDVIAACNVLHATKDMSVTLAHCIKLLKPGGRLILSEFTSMPAFLAMIYGTLPGWWLSQDGRTGGPLMTEPQWDSKLREVGFSGIDYAIGDADTKLARSMALMVSTKPERSRSLIPKAIILIQRGSELQQQAASRLLSMMTGLVHEAKLLFLDEITGSEAEAVYISLCEVDLSLLSDISPDDFSRVQTLVTSCPQMLWVTSSTTPFDPNQKIVSGLFRSAMAENESLKLQELHFQSLVAEDIDQSVAIILQAFQENLDQSDSLGESEMLEIDGILHIPRYVDSVSANERLQQIDVNPVPEMQPLIQADRRLKLTIGSPGMLDTLQFVDDDSHLLPLAPDHVEVQVQANALNFKDVMIAMGRVPGQILGYDAAGVVTAIGSAVSKLQVGDRVAYFTNLGNAANYVRIHESIPQVIPQDMSIEEACTVPVIFSTAYQCLMEAGRLQPGEKVLIHAAAGGLGQALIQLAQHIGAEIYATVGTLAKKDLLISLGVDEDHIFSSRDLSFAQGVMRMTDGQGVDVVVNSLAGESLRKTWECVAEFGRFVEVGLVDLIANTGLEMLPFVGNRSFSGVNLETYSVKRASSLLSKTFSLIRQGAIKPVTPVTIYDYSDMETAFRTMQQGKHSGKVVLRLSADSRVPVRPRKAPAMTLKEDATYLFSGLGGLARFQAAHLVEHGAKNLVFISRSGGATAEAKRMLKELAAQGVRAEAICCDVTNLEDVHKVVASIKQTFPVIKGVIQGAMVLNDGLLQSMTHKQWQTATRPKIAGTWNLHKALPKDLDFFIMLSSCAGILGSPCQSNYAAGNTFQDAFAAYRRSLGLKAHTIDLGAVTGAGYFEQNVKEDASSYINSLKVLHIDARDTLSLLDAAIMGSADGTHEFPAQLITGAGSGGLEKLNKVDAHDRNFPWLSQHARFKYLQQLDSDDRSTAGMVVTADGGDLTPTQLGTAGSLQDAIDLCQEALVNKLAKAIMMDATDIDTTKPLHQYGVDSLVAVEIRNWLMRFLKSDISVFEILADNPISQLASSVATKSRYVAKELLEETHDGE